MSQLYTSGRWTIVPGREEEFVAAWSELAEWTSAEIPGSNWARLLQHQEKRNVFLSFGPMGQRRSDRRVARVAGLPRARRTDP